MVSPRARQGVVNLIYYGSAVGGCLMLASWAVRLGTIPIGPLSVSAWAPAAIGMVGCFWAARRLTRPENRRNAAEARGLGYGPFSDLARRP